jgi:hypothetical protein
MIVAIGLIMMAISGYGLFAYLQGYLAKYVPEWFSNMPLAIVLVVMMFCSVGVFVNAALPPPLWLNELPIKKESSCGVLPVSS